ncbi:unnamed protein product [Heterobilharzia americana]|nr:unnamed protein product [Heterobilharzia americana]
MTSIWNRVYPTLNKKSSRYLIECKKHLKEVLRSGVLGAEAASLDIIELIPGKKYTEIDVNCTLPVCHNFITQINKETQSPTALAFRIQQYVNSGNSEFRSLLHKSYPKMKIPVFHFFVTEQIYTVSVPSRDTGNSESSDDVSNISTFIKPNNVYGLERDKLINAVNSRLKATRKKPHPSESRNLVSEDDCESNEDISREINCRSQTTTFAWAKFWKERQDWRSVAKRERRRACQSFGLDFLTLKHNENDDNNIEK